MNTMESLRQVMLADIAIQTAVADRIYMTVAPPQAARPFVVLTRTTTGGFSTFTSRSTEKRSIQIDSYADTYAAANSLDTAIKKLLDQRNDLLRPELSAIWFENSQDSYEPETERHRVIAEYTIMDRS